MATMTTDRKKAKAPAPAQGEGREAAGVLSVDVPFVATTKYAQRVVYLELREGEASALRGVLEGLELRGTKMPNGKPVASSQDALRWLLQELARVGA
jgi:hypothetical protein